MSYDQVILVTGAGRGLGKGLVSAFLQRPHTAVVAAVRDESSQSSACLRKMKKKDSSHLIVIKIDSSEPADPAAAMEILREKHGIRHLDIVIANAGISHSFLPVLKCSASSIQDHLSINTVGPIVLLQATAALLKASRSGHPRFVAISSLMASLSGMDDNEDKSTIGSPYGASKAALNWFIRAIHFEESWLTCFALHPGFVKTDMVTDFANSIGMTPEAMGAISVEESVAGMTGVIGSATREISGTFKSFDSAIVPW